MLGDVQRIRITQQYSLCKILFIIKTILHYAIARVCNVAKRHLISLASTELKIFENTFRFRASDSTFFDSWRRQTFKTLATN